MCNRLCTQMSHCLTRIQVICLEIVYISYDHLRKSKHFLVLFYYAVSLQQNSEIAALEVSGLKK